MKAFQEAVNKKIESMIVDGSIEKKIQEEAEKAISNAIKDQFSYSGQINTQIREAVKQGLNINLAEIDFETYNQQMLVAINTQLGNLFHGQAYEHFKSQIEGTLKPAPKEMSMGALLEKIASIWRTDDPFYDDDMDSEMSVEIVQGERSMSDSWNVKIWKQKETSGLYSSSRTNSPDIEVYIDDDRIRINHRMYYNPTTFNEAATLIFKLYAAGTKITGIEECNPDMLELYLKEWEE